MASMVDELFEARYRSWAAVRRDLTQQMSIGGLLLRTDARALVKSGNVKMPIQRAARKKVIH